jgi:hypothetical protein
MLGSLQKELDCFLVVSKQLCGQVKKKKGRALLQAASLDDFL